MSQREGKECVCVCRGRGEGGVGGYRCDRGGRVLTSDSEHKIFAVNGKDHYSNIKANIMVNHR